MILDATAGDGDGLAPMPDEWLPIPVAALRLNLSVDAVRRRLRSGQLRGRRVRGERGQRWEVFLGEVVDGVPAPTERPAANGRRRAPDGALPDGRWVDLMRQLLNENAELGRKVSRLHDERAELFGRCGYLQGQLASAQDQIKSLEAPRAAEEPAPRRPWWRLFNAS
jgi:hypothetical protein